MKALAQLVVFSIIGGIVGLVVWLGWEVGTRAVDALDAIGPGLFIALELVLFGVFVFVVIGGAVAIVRWLNLRSRAVHPGQTGLYPVQYHGGGYININHEHAQALAVMHAAGRATSASVNAVLSQPAPVAAELPSVPAMLTPGDVTNVDPRTSPHWLLIGSSGSGKSNASYRILGDLVRRNPCQVIITEPGGVGWGAAATATNTRDIAQTIGDVAGELERRQALLRSADVDHVQDLPEPLPYLLLVCEETETVLDDLKMQDRELRTATVIALRSIARLGRKAGVCLVAITQAGSLDVFDGHIRKNITNTLIFRSEHTVGETWRLGGVRLQDLPPGAAFSVRHGAVVSFPMTARPVLQLVQPAGMTGGIPVADWPTTGRLDAVVPVVDGSDPVVQRLEAGRQPDPTTAATMRRLYSEGWSKTRLCLECWGYKDGAVWSYLERALGGEL